MSTSAPIQIPEDVSQALERAARRRHTTQAEVIVEALRYYLGVWDQAAIDQACREVNATDAADTELQAAMEQVYKEHAFEDAK